MTPYYKIYYRKNRKRIIARNREYYFKNREKWLVHAKEYNRKYPEKRKLAFGKWYKTS